MNRLSIGLAGVLALLLVSTSVFATMPSLGSHADGNFGVTVRSGVPLVELTSVNTPYGERLVSKDNPDQPHVKKLASASGSESGLLAGKEDQYIVVQTQYGPRYVSADPSQRRFYLDRHYDRIS